MNTEKQDVVFIDAYNLIYRAFYGNKSTLKNEEGIPTNAIFTISKMLMNLKKQFTDIAYCIAVFDGSEGNFRKDLDEEYKANRKPMPEDLVLQMPYIKEVFKILGFPVVEANGVEADDIIGTLALRSAKAGFNTFIISGDKDFRQIVRENLHVWDTMNDIMYDPETILEKMEVTVENVVGYLSLLGDSADNVGGVDKVGNKTAIKYLNEYGSIEKIRENQDKLKGVAGQNMRDAFANGKIDKNIQLITLKTDIDMNLTSREMRLKDVDNEKWVEFCKKMNFKSFLAKDLR